MSNRLLLVGEPPHGQTDDSPKEKNQASESAIPESAAAEGEDRADMEETQEETPFFPNVGEENIVLQQEVSIPAEIPPPEGGTSDFNLHLILGEAVVILILSFLLVRKYFQCRSGAGRKQQAPTDTTSESSPQNEIEDLPPTANVQIHVAGIQSIGSRPTQQDCLGTATVESSVLAVIADGMGGLQHGDAVSRRIVQTMLTDSKDLTASQLHDNLLPLVSHANEEVNNMLSPAQEDGEYVSGSTLVTAFAEPDQFQWVSIGDSRIYLLRSGRLLQLNTEHSFEADLLLQAVNRRISFPDARSHPKRRSLTSFIGMGELRYISFSMHPVPVAPGDVILLMSDGIFHTLSESEIEFSLSGSTDPEMIARKIETAVLEKGNPRQDNFSLIVISYGQSYANVPVYPA